jgi:L-asparaginase
LVDRIPTVALFALGGTIAMASESGGEGISPMLDASSIAAALPGLDGIAKVRAQTRAIKPSASITVDDLLVVASRAREAIDGGAAGAVVTQGTDTLEESAYLLDLVWDRDAPLVVTGAMRSPVQPGADGPANVLGAIAAANCHECRELGCIVVINDQIHSAREIQKRHSSNPAAFMSPNSGPIGYVSEGDVHVVAVPSLPRLLLPSVPSQNAKVVLVEIGFDDDGALLSHCAHEYYGGLVVAALGAGHLPKSAAARAIEAATRMPVILASRTGAGEVFAATYNFEGSERHLLAGALISAGSLAPPKARVLRTMLLRAGADRRVIEAAFQTAGGKPARRPGSFRQLNVGQRTRTLASLVAQTATSASR